MVAIVTAGCAGGPTSSASQDPLPTTAGSAAPSACDLISIDQVIEATGGLDVVLATPLSGVSGCAYEVADGSAILAFEFIDDAYWDQTMAGPHLKLNLGTESIFFSDSGILVLLVRDGIDQFAVTVHVPRGSKPALEVAKSLANDLLAQM